MIELRDTDKRPDPIVRPRAEGLLPLPPGGAPKTVFVVPVAQSGGGMVAGFGLSAEGPFFTEGLEWPTDPKWELFIHFMLQLGVVELVPAPLGPTVSFSAPVDGTQDGSVSNVPGVYQFFVEFPDAPRHDPKIIVTPL